jgi:GxxExxY protein
MTKKDLNDLTYLIIGAAIQVHKNLGPGLLESVYHKCFKHELNLRNLKHKSEFTVPIAYKGIDIETDLRCDFVIEDTVVVEIKAVSEIVPIFEAQLLTYMKLLKKPKGILINFNCLNLFEDGQKTFVNEFFRDLPNE